jgi:crotonobetainyl-CoA:carnitine CoA-transferase CaiB-like acyl-CoA transferase
MSGVLDGIRVLDFGRYIAGPWCAALLGDLGAEVIRVERREGSEDRWVVPVAGGGEGSLFLQANRNKLGMTLDPLCDAGRQVTRRLVASADVVVANLPDETLAAMGLDWESVSSIDAKIVLTTVSAFGGAGPWAHKVGFDGIGQAMSGSMYLSGEPGEPTKAYVPWVDFSTGALAAFGTLAALHARRDTGRGQHVRGSLLATALSASNSALIEQALVRADRVASGNRSQIAGPSDAFRTLDGWILVQVIGEPLFRRWTRLVGEEQWLDDPRFATDEARGRHGEVLSERMAKWCAPRTSAQALAELEAARIPAGPILSPQAALDHPQVRGMGLLQPLDYPGLPAPAPVVGTPVELSATPGTIRRPAPRLGEHTNEILRGLGYSPTEIASLHASGAV